VLPRYKQNVHKQRLHPTSAVILSIFGITIRDRHPAICSWPFTKPTRTFNYEEFAVCLSLSGCGPNEKEVSYEIMGSCDECPEERLEKILTAINGVSEANYTEDGLNITIRYNPDKVEENDLVKTINESGYNANGSVGYDLVKPECCQSISGMADDMPALMGETDDELMMDPGNEDALMAEMEEELDLMDELEGEGSTGVSLDESLEESMEEELLLDEELGGLDDGMDGGFGTSSDNDSLSGNKQDTTSAKGNS
jgi:copper chaperone CopZ